MQKFQTTATYDPETEEFTINTPVPTGIKFWPAQCKQFQVPVKVF